MRWLERLFRVIKLENRELYDRLSEACWDNNKEAYGQVLREFILSVTSLSGLDSLVKDARNVQDQNPGTESTPFSTRCEAFLNKPNTQPG